MNKFYSRLVQLSNGLRYLARGDFNGLVTRLKWHSRSYASAKMQKQLNRAGRTTWGVISTPQTLFIANIIAERLAYHNILVEVVDEAIDSFDHDFYVVLCAPILKCLPPPEKRYIFKIEQCADLRLFSPNYLNVLKRSRGVLFSDLFNISYFSKHGLSFPDVHYLPIGASLNKLTLKENSVKKYDFLYWGDSTTEERVRNYLAALKQKFTVRICDNINDEERYDAIRSARVVLNIHQCQDDLLEISHICECISLGVPVLSETSTNQHEYPELAPAVSFFQKGDTADMMARASETLASLEENQEFVESAVIKSSERFNFMMDRFLVAIGALPTKVVLDERLYSARNSSFFALSLPETTDRRLAITKKLPDGCELFDGIRHRMGWIGCGASFSALSRYALSNGCRQLTVIEDDVDLPNNFTNILDEIYHYLASRNNRWDIFSGVMADVHPSAKIYSIERASGRTYVTIDKITSTVFNIYNCSALHLLSKWDPSDFNAATNTIDRYMERQEDLRVVVAIPFIVGHKEDATSTLWGIENQHYTAMIADSQKRIERLMDVWESHQKRQ